MVKLEIGKLYRCQEYHLLVFPTEEKIRTPFALPAGTTSKLTAHAIAVAEQAAKWWSKELDCHVSYIPAGQVFCIVKINSRYVNSGYICVISGKYVGWTGMRPNWLNIEELKA